MVEKFRGVLPALYACYNDVGDISEERTKQLCEYLLSKKIKGLYVGGSSGECIYQTIEERIETLKYVSACLKGKATLIAHVGAPSTRDSIILAKQAEELGYDALSAIPPIYYAMPESAIYNYWNDIISATQLPFIIYNIPQTTGYALTLPLFKRLLKNKRVIGLKNSSMPVMDIERFKAAAGEDFIVFNGPDEQYVAGRLIGADSGIGGTYGVMPELFLKAEEYVTAGDFAKAKAIQKDINNIIIALCSYNGSMYSAIKHVLALKGIQTGGVRAPLEEVHDEDVAKMQELQKVIDQVIQKYE